MQICSEPGCPVPTRTGRCPTHTKAKVQTYDRQRGTAAQRGYGVRWTKYRQWFKDNWPLCGDRPEEATPTEDSECRRRGLDVPMDVVDHIIPVTGPDDPTFYLPEAHQALCERCHNLKRQREGMQARVVR